MPLPARLMLPLAVCASLALALPSHATSNERTSAWVLSNPDKTLRSFFGQEASFVTRNKTLATAQRIDLAEELPLEIPFHDGDDQRLYVAYHKRIPVGVCQVHVVRDPWGLIQVAWVFDLEMRVKDFMVQRCRCPMKNEFAGEAFRKLVIGKNKLELATLLNGDGSALKPAIANHVSRRARGTACSIIRCAIKGSTLTGSMWRRELIELKASELGFRRAPSARSVLVAPDPFGSREQERLRAEGLPIPSAIQRHTALAQRFFDGSGHKVGVVLYSSLPSIEGEFPAFSVLRRGRVHVVPLGDWPSQAVRERYTALLSNDPPKDEEQDSIAVRQLRVLGEVWLHE